MPLTNAQKQAAHRNREKAKMARYEYALRSLISLSLGDHSLLAEMVSKIASEAVSGSADHLKPEPTS